MIYNIWTSDIWCWFTFILALFCAVIPRKLYFFRPIPSYKDRSSLTHSLGYFAIYNIHYLKTFFMHHMELWCTSTVLHMFAYYRWFVNKYWIILYFLVAFFMRFQGKLKKGRWSKENSNCILFYPSSGLNGPISSYAYIKTST